MLTQQRLKEVLYYNPHVGVFVWKIDHKRARRGHTAGGAHKGRGYIKICVDGHSYTAHVLVWLYVYGVFPAAQIDHIDGDRSNNLVSNLRVVAPEQNCWNSRVPTSNTSGFKGVVYLAGCKKYRGSVRNRGKRFYTDLYVKPEDAAAALMDIRASLHGEYANHGVHIYETEEMLDRVI